jgi:hypothetical protein
MSSCVANSPGLQQHAQQVGIIVYVIIVGRGRAPPPRLKPTTVEVRCNGVLDERLQLCELALFNKLEKRQSVQARHTADEPSVVHAPALFYTHVLYSHCTYLHNFL